MTSFAPNLICSFFITPIPKLSLRTVKTLASVWFSEAMLLSSSFLLTISIASFSLATLLLTWGSIGFVANVIAQPHVGEAWRAALVSLPLAAAGSLLVTSLVSHLIVRFVPLNETSARRRHELLGCVGTAIYDVDETSGLAAVRDEDGNLFQVACRVAPGAAAVPKDSRVRLVTYRAAGHLFFVEPIGPAADRGAGGATAAARAAGAAGTK